MTDRPVLNTPGEMLVAARTAAGLDLDAVAAATKIPVGILGHLERDEYHRVSGALYVNSFLRTYATEVGIEPSLVLEAYSRFSGERMGPSQTPAGDAVWAEEEVQIKRVGLPWLQIALAFGVGLVLIGAAVWFFGLRGGHQTPLTSTGPGSGEQEVVAEQTGEAPAASAATDEDTGPQSADEAGDRTEPAAQVTVPVIRDEQSPPNGPDARLAESRLPRAEEGVPSLNFADGNRWPLVLRVTTPEPVGIEVVRDSDREPVSADWIADPTQLPSLPTVGVEHGQPYRVQDGYVVYWGARDQFSLRLDGTRGVVVELNGNARDLSGLQPGQELILFLPSGRR